MEQRDINPAVVLLVKDIQYIKDNFRVLQYECKDRVAEVRKFLEEECGFKTQAWKTNDHLNLVWLNTNDGYVNGNIRPRTDLQKCDIHDLVNEYFREKQKYKPINLKG